MLKLSAVAVAVVLLSNPMLAQAQQPATRAASAQSLAGKLDALFKPQYKAEDPGATVIVVKDGKTVFRKAYGAADVAAKTPLTPGTVLRLGSITKQFTAVAILMLAEEGKLALNDPITRFFPDYPTGGKVITVEHLLTHTSGIVSYTGKSGYVSTMAKDFTVAQMIDGFRNDPLEFEPGTQFRYNNSGYFLLGAIIERVSGTSYASFLEQRIFTPLGMKDTAYEGVERSNAPRAIGYSAQEKGFAPAQPLSMSQPYAAGALVSTVDDLAKWDAAIASGKLLKPASWKMAFTPYQLTPEKSTGYGYGWGVGTLQGTPVIEHGGGINGFSTYALRLPEKKIFVAVLGNADSGSANPEVLAKKAAALAMGKPFMEPKAFKLDAKALDGFTGVYDIDGKEKRIFTSRDGNLMMARGDRSPAALTPYSKDGFFFPGTLARFEFGRDAQGKVTHVTVDNAGERTRNERVGDAPAEREAVKIDNAGFDARAGAYQLAPQFTITLSREGERYYAQATGQRKIEIFPASEDVFFSRDVNAELRFEKGADGAPVVVLHQNGQATPGKRLQ
ncbi:MULTISPECIES: serine hydrolase [Massilia]|uniref:serine hydrolase n=1 Tax=Massilia TaxID=149698 RepID=UPI001C6398C9|nr:MULTISPECIES: serine hydrolase [Massilia]QYG00395.1 serine hydrolase [Massilia sp. NP310]